jgi:hypothetical protein
MPSCGPVAVTVLFRLPSKPASMTKRKAKPEYPYLAIRNWDKYQTSVDGQSASWIKDWTDKDSDYEHAQLSVFQSGILDRLRRLRGKLGRNLPNNPEWLMTAACVPRRDRPNAVKTIEFLRDMGMLIPTTRKCDGAKPASAEKPESVEPDAAEPKPRSSPTQSNGSLHPTDVAMVMCSGVTPLVGHSGVLQLEAPRNQTVHVSEPEVAEPGPRKRPIASNDSLQYTDTVAVSHSGVTPWVGRGDALPLQASRDEGDAQSAFDPTQNKEASRAGTPAEWKESVAQPAKVCLPGIQFEPLKYSEALTTRKSSYTPEQVRSCVHYWWLASGDSYWRNSIKTPDSLKRAFDEMWQQMQERAPDYRRSRELRQVADPACPICRGTGSVLQAVGLDQVETACECVQILNGRRTNREKLLRALREN